MKIRIENPCSQKWGEMTNISKGKYCSSCSKAVHDLDQLKESDLTKILESGAEICGKISRTKPFLSSILLALTITSFNFSTAQTTENVSTETVFQQNITIKGMLFSNSARKLLNAEISLITLEKVYSAQADLEGNFSLTFPEKFLKDHNVVRIDYNVLDDNNKEFADYSTSVLSRKEMLTLQKFQVEEKYVTIGAVVIGGDEPPDFYYFNGKKVGKRKFEKLRKQNPDYKYLAFYDETAIRTLTNKTFIDNLYLLTCCAFSN